MFYHFKMAVRNLSRNGIYSGINIAGLAISLAAVITIALWVDNELNFNRWYSRSDRLYVPCSDEGQEGVSETMINSFRTEFPEIRCVSNFTSTDRVTLYMSDDNLNGFNELGAYVDSTLFEMLDINLVRGSAISALRSPFSVVISRRLAEKMFGNDDPIGKTLRIDNYAELMQVTGVFKEQPQNSSFRFEWLIPFEILTTREGWDPVNGWNMFDCCVELQPNVDVAALNEKLKDFASISDEDEDVFLYPITKLHLYGEFVDGMPVAGKRVRDIREFSIIALIILIIACINFMNLSTARSEKRMMEMGIRKTFGAKRRILIWQLMRESAILTVTSLAIALMIIYIALPTVSQYWDIDLSIRLLNIRHLCGILIVGIFCTVLSGIYPSIYISAFHPNDILKKMKNRSAHGVAMIRKGLVVFQFTASCVLICMTIAVFLQIRLGRHRPLGYEKEHLLQVSGVSNLSQSVIRNELGKSTLIKDIAFSNDLLVQIGSTSDGFQWQGKSGNINPRIHRYYVSQRYIETIGLKLLEGRNFYEDSESDANSVIINKTLAGMMDDEGRINGELWQGDRGRSNLIYTVIGIIDDYICDDFYREKSEPLMLHKERRPSYYLYVRFNPQADAASVLKTVQNTLSQFQTDRPLEYAFVDDLVNRMFDGQRRDGYMASLFSILSVLISCLGLFGLATYVAESKIKEIGIRKVFGASTGKLVVMLTKEFLILGAISTLIAFPFAYFWIDRMLQDYAYRISIGWEIFIISLLITIVLTLATVSLQAFRAATANPVDAIKVE